MKTFLTFVTSIKDQLLNIFYITVSFKMLSRHLETTDLWPIVLWASVLMTDNYPFRQSVPSNYPANKCLVSVCLRSQLAHSYLSRYRLLHPLKCMLKTFVSICQQKISNKQMLKLNQRHVSLKATHVIDIVLVLANRWHLFRLDVTKWTLNCLYGSMFL